MSQENLESEGPAAAENEALKAWAQRAGTSA